MKISPSAKTIPFLTPPLEVVVWMTSEEGEILGPVEAYQIALASGQTKSCKQDHREGSLVLRFWFRLPNLAQKTLNFSSAQVSIAGMHKPQTIPHIRANHGDTIEFTYDLCCHYV